MGVNSHLERMDISFIDKDGKVFAVTCIPRTPYYVYTPIGIVIKKGLKAIHFDGHGGQVPGNVNISNIEVYFGPLPKNKNFLIHEWSDGQCPNPNAATSNETQLKPEKNQPK